MSVYGLHRHPAYWDRPDAFEPLRFIDRKAPRNRAYMPFVVGKHRCIGDMFALVELAITVSAVVKRFLLRPVDPAPIEPMPRVTLAPSRPIMLVLEPRS